MLRRAAQREAGRHCTGAAATLPRLLTACCSSAGRARCSWTLPVPGRRASEPLLWRQDVVEEETETGAYHVGALTPPVPFAAWS